ncbi:MAG: DNA repair protein RecN [Desulfobacterales bacterium]|nr:DNA repair protein RecN [Desulfobacterales bacterium]
MLRELAIKNFAIIDDLKISFSDGLTILSGETGAGKSIIINAANLLLGSRATAGLIRTGSKTAELQALFQIKPQSRVAGIMQAHGFDTDDGLLINRIISRSDRHKIYINGRLGTIALLNTITENLASISGQHAHQGLLKEERQLLILDQLGGLMPLRHKVHKCYHQILPLIQNLRKLQSAGLRQADHLQLLEFQQKEITAASVSLGEDVAFEQERVLLKNAEELYLDVHNSLEELYTSEGAIIERLVEVKKNLDRACQIDPSLSSKAENLATTTFQMEDVAAELRIYLKNIQPDEKRLEEVEVRLDTLNRLKRKYGGSLEAVLAKLDAIEHELAAAENISLKIVETKEKLAQQHTNLVKLADNLSRERKDTAKTLARKVMQELTTLEMSQTKFEVSLQALPAGDNAEPHLTSGENALHETGSDRAIFLIAPNVGEPLKPLFSIVSGGELSRVVLALKAILAETEALETIVFDEVDAGIGGAVAAVVGKKLAALARHHQIICITHLPQIAKFGDHHFRIAKHVFRGRTTTSIKRLSAKDRIKEVARMLGGEKITQATLDHAHEMLNI